MIDHNPTTRKYPRTLAEAYPEPHAWLEAPTKPKYDPDYWVMLVCAFAGGFLTALLFVRA